MCIDTDNSLVISWWRIYVSVNCVIIGQDNGLAPVRHQAITWTNDDLLLIVKFGSM